MEGQIGFIISGNGRVFLIDEDEYDKVSRFSWTDGNGYAIHHTWIIGVGPGKPILMHRLIMGLPDKSLYVDHINLDTYDNRKANLRICTPKENKRNRNLQANNSSGYKGVYWSDERKKWVAQIKINNKQTPLGRYMSVEEAARAYDRAAIRNYGEFARPNFPLSDYKEF